MEDIESASTRAFATICTRSYLPMATVLMRSIQRFHPDASRFILVVDGGTLQSDVAEIIGPDFLDLSEFDFDWRVQYYDAVELCTSLKASLLKTLLKDFDVVTYLDPDVELFAADNIPVARNLGPWTVLATPHRLTPPPLDGLMPSERTFLTYGVLNLGYLSVCHSSHDFLVWWDERLRFFSRNAPAMAEFTDQKWMDLAMTYFDVKVIKHPGYNVAPWNLDERNLQVSGHEYRVGELPLVFFHFSGIRSFGPETPALLGSLGWRLVKMPARVRNYVGLGSQWSERVGEAARTLSQSTERPSATRRHRVVSGWERRKIWREARRAVALEPKCEPPVRRRAVSPLGTLMDQAMKSSAVRAFVTLIPEDAGKLRGKWQRQARRGAR